jgi:hypothetical protein
VGQFCGVANWQSKVAQSSSKAKYHALAKAAKEAQWL